MRSLEPRLCQTWASTACPGRGVSSKVRWQTQHGSPTVKRCIKLLLPPGVGAVKRSVDGTEQRQRRIRIGQHRLYPP